MAAQLERQGQGQEHFAEEAAEVAGLHANPIEELQVTGCSDSRGRQAQRPLEAHALGCFRAEPWHRSRRHQEAQGGG